MHLNCFPEIAIGKHSEQFRWPSGRAPSSTSHSVMPRRVQYLRGDGGGNTSAGGLSPSVIKTRRPFNMMGHPTFHDIDSALAEANNMPPEEAAEMRKAAMEAIAGNVRMMLCMTRGSVFTTQDCQEYSARLPDVFKREVIRSFKEHRPLDMASSM